VEIHVLTPDALRLVHDVPMYGRIATLELFKPPLEPKHLLFIATERHAFCVLSYDASRGELITRASGDLSDRIGRPSECGQLGVVDPECRCVGLHAYDGLFKIIPMDQRGQLRDAFNVRLEELQVIDLKFLHGGARPTLAVLYEDAKEGRHVKTYEVNVAERDLEPGPWAMDDVEGGSSMIIPVPAPLGGALVIGETVVVYLNGRGDDDNDDAGDRGATEAAAPRNGGGFDGAAGSTGPTRDRGDRARSSSCFVKAVASRADLIMSYGAVDKDGSRVLLSDALGTLHLLVVVHDGARAHALKLEPLGETSVASTLSYLDDGVVYVGSAYGDSHLIRLHAQPVKDEETNDPMDAGGPSLSPMDADRGDASQRRRPSYVEILETYPNLGPIVDFAAVDLDGHGQGQAVTCSGVAKDGTLRIIRNGVGIEEQAAIELPGVRGCWSLRRGDDDEHDAVLVVAFRGETRALAMIDETDELAEHDVEGFAFDEETLACANVRGNAIAQCTSAGVRVADAATGRPLASWSPPASLGPVSVAAVDREAGAVVLGFARGALVSLLVAAPDENDKNGASGGGEWIREGSRAEIGAEVACVDASGGVCVVGTWSRDAKTLRVPDLTELSAKSLDEGPGAGSGPGSLELLPGAAASSAIPRSALLAELGGAAYAFVGLGDGQLLRFHLGEDGVLGEHKRITLGTRPIALRAFANKGATHVFAGSDRPTVISSANGKLTFSGVNAREILLACPFNARSFPDSLALATETGLAVGAVDDIQKLHVRTVPLHEQPRRIAHQASTGTFAVLTQSSDPETREQTSWVRLIDAATFETTDRHALERDECDSSVVSCAFADDPREYYVVGTAFQLPEEVEPSKGRILVFEAREGKLALVAQKRTTGAVYNLNALRGKLVAGVNSKIQVFEWRKVDSPESNDANESEASGRGKGKEGLGAGAVGPDANGPSSSPPRELALECANHGHIVALYARVRGDLIVVGDLMKSVSLLEYDPERKTLEERARDFNPNWMTAVDVLDDDHYLGAENSFNLFTLRRDRFAATEEARSRLDVVGAYHLGEFVNRFRRGSLVMSAPERAPSRRGADGSGSGSGGENGGAKNAVSAHGGALDTLLFGTVNGAVGVLARLPEARFDALDAVQRGMRAVVSGVGGFSHEKWRSFHNEHRTAECKNFIDGDLVESFLDLRREKAEEVAKIAGRSVDELVDAVEAVARSTH
jgi:DNA damage-binding protein 1